MKEMGYSGHAVNAFGDILVADRTVEICALVPDPDAVAKRIATAVETQGLDVLSQSPAPLVSIKAPGIDKATGLQKLCKHICIDLQNAVAFGDGTNDVPMLSVAGLGIAVANA